MSPSAGVRSHTRRTASGKTIKVNQHRRKTTGPTDRRAKRNALRAFKAVRRGKKGLALKLGGLAVVEIAAWAVLQGAVLMVTTFILVLVTTLIVCLGGAPKRRRRRRTVKR